MRETTLAGDTEHLLEMEASSDENKTKEIKENHGKNFINKLTHNIDHSKQYFVYLIKTIQFIEKLLK